MDVYVVREYDDYISRFKKKRMEIDGYFLGLSTRKQQELVMHHRKMKY